MAVRRNVRHPRHRVIDGPSDRVDEDHEYRNRRPVRQRVRQWARRE